jgi:hypothetical protein
MRELMKPHSLFLSVQNLCASILLAFCFSLGSPAWAQSSQLPELDWAYCNSLVEGHPDVDRCEDWLYQELWGVVGRDDDQIEAESASDNRSVISKIGSAVVGATVGGFIGTGLGITLSDGGVGGLGSTGHVVGAITGVAVGGFIGVHAGFKSVAFTIGGSLVGSIPGGMAESAGLAIMGASVGGALGYMLSRRSVSRATQVSVAPYMHSEGSGLMFSGQF